jgi:hypothetical protein
MKQRNLMKYEIKRKRYFINPASQLTFIIASIIPALIMTVFCTQIFILKGEEMLTSEKERILDTIYQIRHTYNAIEKNTKINNEDSQRLKSKLDTAEKSFESTYSLIPGQWNKTKLLVLLVLMGTVLITIFVSILWSHKMSGGLFRMTRVVDQLNDGEKIPEIKIRTHDHFKVLCQSLEKLRITLEKKGFLK